MSKRILILLTTACLLSGMAGCMKDVSTGEAVKPLPIIFRTPAVTAVTRTAAGYPNHDLPVTYSTSEHFAIYALDQFDIFANLSAAEKSRYYIERAECVYNSVYDAWETSPRYYWLIPGNSGNLANFRLTFQAYSPFVAYEDCTLTHTWDDGFTFTGFIPREPGQQYDLLYSDILKDRKRPDYNPDKGAPYEDDSDDAGSYSGIDLCFHHTLSCVKFEVKAKVPQDAIQEIHLQKLSVKGVWNKGTFTQSVLPADPWVIDADASEYEYVVYQNTSSKATDGLRIYEEQGFVPMDNILMIVPQDLLHLGADPVDDSDDTHITLEITYSRTISASNKTVTTTETADLVTGNAGSYFQDSGTASDIDAWLMGRRYTYKLTLNLFKVFVDPVVTGWNDFDPEQNMNL